MTPSGSSSASRRPAAARSATLVLLDANILVRAARPGFFWLRETERLTGPVRVAVPESVLRELDRLVRRDVPGAALAARLGRTLPSVRAPGEGDDAILAAAAELGATVLTADRELAARLRVAGVDVLAPRDRTRLELRRASVRSLPRSASRATVKKRARLRTGIGERARRHARR